MRSALNLHLQEGGRGVRQQVGVSLKGLGLGCVGIAPARGGGEFRQ